jgi:hypothetical protein
MDSSILTGALIGLVIGGGVVVVFFIIAMNRKPEYDAKTSRSGTLASPLPPADVIAALEAGAPERGLKVAAVDKAGNRMVLGQNITLFSWGMYLPVHVTPEGSGSTLTVGLYPRAPQYGPVLTHKHNKAMEAIRAIVAGGEG